MSSRPAPAALPGSSLAPPRSIRLIGPPAVAVDGRPLVVDTRKAIALLAYVGTAHRAVPRSELAALLWPESDDEAARAALRRTLSVLNAALGGTGLAITRSAVALEGAWEIDIRRLDAALAAVRGDGHGPDEPCAACLHELEVAADLARGDFMAGFGLRDSEPWDDWQRTEAEAIRRDLAAVLERLARAHAAASDWPDALDAGRRWLALDPLHEPAHRLVMLILARAGEPAAAIRQYRECVRVLDAELAVAPLDETTRLYEAIRTGEVAADARRTPREEPAGAARVAPGRAPAPSPEPPLVGREVELAALEQAWASAGPEGRLVLVEGEPGIGKTRLVAAFTSAVGERGAVVLESRAYPGEGGIAFGPIQALVREGLARPGSGERLAALGEDALRAAARVVPPLASIAGVGSVDAPLDAFGRARAIEAVATVLGALVSGPVPGVLVVDDAHWADASTLELLAFLARRLRRRPLTLLLTWRPSEAGDDERRALLAAADRDRLAVSVPLDRLSRADVAELAAVARPGRDDGFVDALYAESEGLPLYVAEVLAVEGDRPPGVPRGVLELLRARVAEVGEVAGQVLAAASVVGRSFDFEIVRAASGRGEDETVAALEELAARGLVREVGAVDADVRLDFTHGRLRDVAYESLGLVRRRLLHRRVADALRAHPAGPEGDGTRWARIALHETEAGRLPEAAEAHRHAAAAARAVFANREAREHLEAALALETRPSAAVHESLGEVLTLLGDYAAAIAHLEAAAAVAEPEQAWSIERDLGLVHLRLGDPSRAASHLDAALDGCLHDAARAVLLADRSAIAGQVGDARAAAAFAAEALELAERTRDPGGIARACHVLGVLARGRGDLAAAAAFLERALTESAGAGDPSLRIASLNALALVRGASGDRAAALALVDEALALCVRQGDRHRQAALENNLADLLRAEGRRDEAMEHLKRAVAIFAEIEGRPGMLEPEIWKLVEW